MTVSSTLKIGEDVVDVSKPCDVALALKKAQLKIAMGGHGMTVRIDDEEVTFQRAEDTRLVQLIDRYERACARATPGAKRQRFAKRVKFR